MTLSLSLAIAPTFATVGASFWMQFKEAKTAKFTILAGGMVQVVWKMTRDPEEECNEEEMTEESARVEWRTLKAKGWKVAKGWHSDKGGYDQE